MSEKLLQPDDKSRLIQLYLLSFMRVDSNELSEALRQLRSTEDELEAVKTAMKGHGYEAIGGPRVQFYLELLGHPVCEEPIDNHSVPAVFHDSKALHFQATALG